MTTPPPPQGPQGQWPAQPPAQGQPPTPPPGYPMPAQQYGPPPGQYPGWPPAGPPKKSSGLKWVLAGVALIAVIAVAVAITAVVLRSDSDSGSGGKGGSSSTSGIASADDTGPVGIITAEPTCTLFGQINNALVAQEQNGWIDRDPSVPASALSPEQRRTYEAVGAAIRDATDQFVTLARQTPHRVTRELYEQSIAYGRAYVDSIPHLTANDDQLVRTFNSATGALVGICEAINYGSAAARAVLVDSPSSPSRTASVGDPSRPVRFISASGSICSQWLAMASKSGDDLTAWRAIDSGIPATEWTPEQKAVNDDAAQIFLALADNTQSLAQQTDDPILQDFLTLNAQYQRAYAKALPTYVPADGYLSNAGMSAGSTITAACRAVGG